MTVFEELKARGYIAQSSNEERIKHLLENEKVTFYIGFDPTADSLHVGSLLQLMVMSRLQRAGHRPIAILGGGTAMVGDPSGKSDMRQMLTREMIGHNADCFKCQMANLVDFSDGKGLMIDNGDWLLKLNYVNFLREVGMHFSVNRMLTAECYKARKEKGLSFLEFNYMLMQSYDFLYLYREYGCTMQFGGDDQWSNILSGADLIRRVTGKEAYGMTFTLLTTSDGKKMGKTATGAVWLDGGKTPPFEFYQYWRNVDDGDVIRCLKLLTFVPLEEIQEYEKLEGAQLNEVKERLAFEVTKLIHGGDEALKVREAARAVFSQGVSENIPTTMLTNTDLTDGVIGILDLLVKCGLCPSKGEARRLIEQGGVEVNDCKISQPAATFTVEQLGDGVLIKKGKKTYHRAGVMD